MEWLASNLFHQYQKQPRLHEALRIMLAEKLSTSSSGLAVVYESATQFNREYKKLFGTPPHKDIARILS